MQKNKNRPGYKRTKVGWVPDDWDCCRLRAVAAKITDGTHDTPTPVETGIPYITAVHVKDGAIDFTAALRLTPSDHAVIFKRCNPERGDLLMVNIGAGTASVAHVDVDFEFSMKNVALVKPDTAHLLGKFLELYQLSVKERLFHSLTAGGAQPFLSLRELGRLLIPLPSLPEQKAIAEVLECWDKAIRGYERKIEKKRNIKKGLMQRLLSGRQRLPGFDGEWNICRIRDICEILKGSGLSKDATSMSGARKCILYGEIYTTYGEVAAPVVSRTDAGDGISSRSGDVLIPSSTTTTALDLATATTVLEDDVLLGGDINIIRKAKPESFDGVFLAYYLTHTMTHELARVAQGITIVHLYGRDIGKLILTIPGIQEQEAIAAVLIKAEAEIRSLERKLAALREQKRFLLNNMVTGTLRLPQFLPKEAL